MNESGMDPRVLERCFNCMEQLHYPEEVCPSCGWDNHNRENVEDQLGQTVLNNQYIVGRALGRGGFGITYVGFDRNLKIRIAIKEYYPVAISRRMSNRMTVCPFTGQENEQDFEEGKASVFTEGQTVAALGQINNVLRVYNVFEANNTVYIIMEYVEGETLAQLVKKQGPLKWPTVKKLMTPVMDALQKIHDKGVIHRDVSPDNIMTNQDMTKTVLLDFGAARVARRGRTMTLRQGARQVQQGDYEVVLRPGYAPIEQYNAKSRLDGRVDEYAACATMYHLLTGRTPEDSMQLMITHASLEKPSKYGCKLPAEVEKALMKGLSLERDKRYKTISELQKALDDKPFPWKGVVTGACVSGALVILIASGPGKKVVDKIVGIFIHPTATPEVTVTPQTDAPPTAGPTTAAPPSVAPPSVAPPSVAPPTPTPTPVPEWQRMRGDTLTIDQLDEGEGTVLGSDIPRADIKSIAFSGSLEGAQADAWDVSEAGDGTVLAWVSDGALTIAGNGGVRAPEDAMGMFANYANATSIRLNGCLDTSETTNMLAMFYRSSALEALDLTGLDTSAATDMAFMFDGLEKLKALDVSGFDTGRVENMSTMFQNCASLETLDVSGFDTSNVTAMEYMFNNCTSLKGTLDVSGFDTGRVKSFKHMFYGCGALEEIRVGQGFVIGNDADTVDMYTGTIAEPTPTPVAEWQRMRSDVLSDETRDAGTGTVLGSDILRSEITSIEVRGELNGAPGDAWDVSEAGDGSVMAWVSDGALTIAGSGGVQAPENAARLFAEYSNVTQIRFNGLFDTSETTDMFCMFENCAALKSVDVSGFNTANVTDMGFMFNNCGQLEALDVSGFDTAGVTGMRSMFSSCAALKALDVSGFNTANVTNMRSMFNCCEALESVDVSGFNTANVTDMSFMFNKCAKLKTVDVRGFDTSNVTDMNTMFQLCASLETLDVSGFDTSNVTDMTTLFYGCEALQAVDVSGFDTSKVTSMRSMFSACRQLKALDVSRFDTANVENMAFMFSECEQVEALDVSGFNTSKVTTMSSMFDTCQKLESLDVSGFDTSSATDLSFMFSQCKSLKSLDVTGFDTSGAENLSTMFQLCTSLETLDLTGFNTSNTTALDYMFHGCSSLKGTLDLSGFDTGRVTTFKHMFYGCSALEEIRTGPNFVIGDGADTEDMYTNTTAKLVDASDSAPTTRDHASGGVLMKGDTLTIDQMSEGEGTVLGSAIPRSDIQGIVFQNTLDGAPDTAWDISEAGDGSALAWVIDDVLTVAGNGGLRAPENARGMFANYTNAKSMRFNGCLDTSGVRDMLAMFYQCGSMQTLDLSGFDTSGVTDMSFMFDGCSSLTALDLSGFNTASALDMNTMFQGCASLTALDLSGFDTSNVTWIQYMFNNCTGLRTLDVSSFDTHSATNMRQMFFNCSSLKALDISSFDTSGVTDFTNMFAKSGIQKGGLKTSDSFVFLDAGDLVVDDIFSETIKFDVGGMKREDWQKKMTVAPQASEGAAFDSADWLGEVLVELGYSSQADIDKANGSFNGKMKQQVKAFKKAAGLAENSLVDAECIRALCAALQGAAHP